jgi:NTP pyrophosphatase (non-canonical NTP hydrolase)
MNDLNTFSSYQAATERTGRVSSGEMADDKINRMTIALGLAGEAGEVVDLIKKVEGHGHPLDRNKLQGELGDLLWYTARLAELYGIKLEDCAAGNIAKLQKRYPNGFSTEASIARVDKE